MDTSTAEGAKSLSKFRGCLLGALMGDCLGAPFESEYPISTTVIQKYFDKMESPDFKSPVKMYTDDTAMTKSVAESLIHNAAFIEKDMARRFVTEYFREPKRGYGGSVIQVFKKLKATKLEDVWLPAREQFSGVGSFGNGAAMRVSPLALFCYNNKPMLIELVTKASRITHANKLGINGAVLQALAIQQSFNLDPEKSVDAFQYISGLTEEIAKLEIEEQDNTFLEDTPGSYREQLQVMEELLKVDNVPNTQIKEVLGNDITAIHSVPVAIYCFLRAQNSIPFIKTDNTFRRVLQYSISMGGDTDTIASMAGAIAGAHLGDSCINKTLMTHCEGVEFVKQLADELHSVTFNA